MVPAPSTSVGVPGNNPAIPLIFTFDVQLRAARQSGLSRVAPPITAVLPPAKKLKKPPPGSSYFPPRPLISTCCFPPPDPCAYVLITIAAWTSVTPRCLQVNRIRLLVLPPCVEEMMAGQGRGRGKTRPCREQHFQSEGTSLTVAAGQ